MPHVVLADHGKPKEGPYRLRCADLSTGKTLREVALADGMYDLALSVDERCIAVAATGTLIINSSTLETIAKLDTGVTWSCHFSLDGRWIATGGEDKVARIFDAQNFQVVSESGEGHSNIIKTIGFSPSSHTLVTGSDDQTAIIWSAPKLSVLHRLIGHTNLVRKALFISDELVATASWDYTVRVWNGTTGALVKDITLHAYEVNSLALSPDGEHFATGGKDKRVFIFNVESLALEQKLKTPDPVYRVAYADDNTIITAMLMAEPISLDIHSRKTTTWFARIIQPMGIVVCSEQL